MQRIALISEHASPLANAGSVDSGGQNVYVGQLASHLALRGFDVDIFSRRGRPGRPRGRRGAPGGRGGRGPAAARAGGGAGRRAGA